MIITPEEFGPGLLIYAGNMAGGKTAKMIFDLQRAEVAKKRVQAVRISWDNRYEEGYITANNQQLKFPATSVPNLDGLEAVLHPKTEILGIDELQFWDERILKFIREYRDKIRIIGTLLQHDFRGEPFPLRSPRGMQYDSDKNVGELMALSTLGVQTFFPVCTYPEGEGICGMKAPYVQRINPSGEWSSYNEPTIAVGRVLENGEEELPPIHSYGVRCPTHYVRPEKK